MAITKCRIPVPQVNRFTGTRTCFLRLPARHGNVSNIDLEGEIMNKTNDTSNLDHDTLADSELDAVTGGMLWLSNVLKMLEDTNKAIIGNIR
jgi:hypothetical protein